MAKEASSTYRRYNMHKYWGKKPAQGLLPLIQKYTKEGDTVLDPFSGYGVFCCEAYLANRNAISNDLNPAANFITRVLMDENVNLDEVKKVWRRIEAEMEGFVKGWYDMTIDGTVYSPISILRNHNDIPISFSYKEGKKTQIKSIPRAVAEAYLNEEKERIIEDWYPDTGIIPNSRISAQKGTHVSDLFTKRTLACHAKLCALINRYASASERDLLMLAFTANLANCSKLVPPINSRGELAQGAWMTGFYVGETYIENNVLHYFENRLKKAISGKEEYLSLLKRTAKPEVHRQYVISNQDARNIILPDESIDYIFTDPPYGDTVPYFEQSIIWNAWLGLNPNYADEIVVSDSTEREKDIEDYSLGMNRAIAEISRVLKPERYFSITYHSLSGREWRSITNACLQHGFTLVDYAWLEQKTLPPRQLARQKTVKGDVLVTFKKKQERMVNTELSEDEFQSRLQMIINKCIVREVSSTNDIMMSIMKWILQERIIVNNTDVFEYLNTNYSINDQGQWEQKD